MFTMKSAVLSVVVLALGGVPAFAASSSMSGSKMAPSEMKTMHECQSMSHSAMMKDKNCTALMKKYPKMTSNSSMNNGSMKSSGSMKTKTSMKSGGSGSMQSGGNTKAK